MQYELKQRIHTLVDSITDETKLQSLIKDVQDYITKTGESEDDLTNEEIEELTATMTYTQLVTSFLLALTFQFLTGCSLNEKQLKTGWWKYGEGYHWGDVVDFNKGFSISGDTILQNGHRVGVITRKITGMFGYDNEIEITSLDKKQSGVYHQK